VKNLPTHLPAPGEQMLLINSSWLAQIVQLPEQFAISNSKSTFTVPVQ
jgi:hypothetical protein